jgi:hypothetical protein
VPFTLLFAPPPSPTALTTLCGCLAAAQSSLWAGVGMGLAIATKQQGIFFTSGYRAIGDLRFTIYDLRHHSLRVLQFTPRSTFVRFTFHLALLLTLLPIFIWNVNRSQAPDF